MMIMPMRMDCKNYESRTYANGEVVRKCRIDLAPEAPWRCPDDCVGYERRMIDAGWQVGSLEKGYDGAGARARGRRRRRAARRRRGHRERRRPRHHERVRTKKPRRFGKRKKRK